MVRLPVRAVGRRRRRVATVHLVALLASAVPVTTVGSTAGTAPSAVTTRLAAVTVVRPRGRAGRARTAARGLVAPAVVRARRAETAGRLVPAVAVVRVEM